MRMQNEILHLKNEDRQCDNLSQYTTDDEERYWKKRKERESDRLSYDDHDEQDLRRPPPRPSENVCDTHKRNIWPLPSQPLLWHSLQHVLHQGLTS